MCKSEAPLFLLHRQHLRRAVEAQVIPVGPLDREALPALGRWYGMTNLMEPKSTARNGRLTTRMVNQWGIRAGATMNYSIIPIAIRTLS
ncbi:hypothetical protein D3C81_1527380 [compost metagenome]